VKRVNGSGTGALRIVRGMFEGSTVAEYNPFIKDIGIRELGRGEFSALGDPNKLEGEVVGIRQYKPRGKWGCSRLQSMV